MGRGVVLRLLAFAAVVVAAAFAGLGPARAGTPLLSGEGQASFFAPCNWTSGGPPPLTTCTNTISPITASCNPAGDSTIGFTETGFIQSGPYQGTFSETVTATIGPQTGPAAPAFQPFAFTGAQVGSIGLPTGRILSFDAQFTINGYDGTTISGTKSLVGDLANTGVCIEPNNEQLSGPVFGTAPPVTGYFYILNAQVLSYAATITAPGGAAVTDSGPAESYLMNSFGTYPNSTDAATSTGMYIGGFGTTHPATGTTSSATTPTGTNVAVSPAPGVDVSFGDITGAGTTSVVETQTAPALPAGFTVGDPPMYYDLSTTATFSGTATVCFPEGPPPAGMAPRLLHYENGQWVDVTVSYDALTQTICGQVTSFSPFAPAYAPARPTTTAQCKSGGWKQFTAPAFKNEGDCVSYVATKGRNGGNG